MTKRMTKRMTKQQNLVTGMLFEQQRAARPSVALAHWTGRPFANQYSDYQDLFWKWAVAQNVVPGPKITDQAVRMSGTSRDTAPPLATEIDAMRSSALLAATQANLAMARKFVFEKWRERAQDLGNPIPTDLSGSCKFTSRFALEVFGGEIQGNFFHQWVELRGLIIDLNEHSHDVAELAAGRIPGQMLAYAQASRRMVPADLYTHDALSLRSPDHRESMASVAPRVTRWVAQFRAMMVASIHADPMQDLTAR
jgi:hypothetical protein